MELIPFALVSLLVLGYGTFSKRLENSWISPAMVFVIFGLIVGVAGLGLITTDMQNSSARIAVEITLVMILFTDGCCISLRSLRHEHALSLRLLWLGMPIIIMIGALIAFVLFDFLDGWQAALLAAVLAPTDAALGQAALNQEGVPKRIRDNLVVESGLNDGLVVPVILFLLVCESLAAGQDWAGFWVVFFLKQVGFGFLIGLGAGYLGNKLVSYASSIYRLLFGIALALLSYSVATLIEGNGFIAAFVAGIAFGRGCSSEDKELHEFLEAISQLLALITFMLFGAVMVPSALESLTWQVVVYAILSLTVVRIVAVFLAVRGMGLSIKEQLFVGWMGPRGVASVLFGLLVLETLNVANREQIFVVVAVTVLISVFAHGLSAKPLASWLKKS